MAASIVRNFVASFIVIGIIHINIITSDTCVPKPSKCVCYDPIGCFSNDAPFNNAHGRLPKSPSDIDVQVQVFTRKNVNDTDMIDFKNKTTLIHSHFDPDLHTKIVIHGFANTIQTEWLYDMKNELLKKGNFNVFIVSWGDGATFPDYDGAVANSRVVARVVIYLIRYLVDLGLSPDELHLIGHSLGAQLSGVAGRTLKAENITIGRISGMDPAEPDFLNYKDSIRLSKDDAKFVDVIHTDGQPFTISTGYGIYLQSGHVDFYINGGEKQPDCPNPISNIFGLLNGGADALTTAFACSHSRSHEVFLESINSMCSFTAYPCESYEKFQAGECLSCGPEGCTRMGYPANRYGATGKFYLNTRRSPPFCGHHYRATLQLSEKAVSTRGQILVQLNGTWGQSEWLEVTKSNADRLSAGARVNRVVVAEKIVGYVQSVNVNFTSSSGGKNSVMVDHIEIEAGESGLQYVFCMETALTSGQIMHVTPVSNNTC